ncbi:MAG: hypothetical protein PHP14_03635 [Candidatus Pacebacteria bacterium]|nr:hypothetical protein [Candidatus Paceibacterota bacterium]
MTDVGILYSYINKKGERIFDSFDKKVTIPAKNDDLKYYNYDFEKTITIPRDINVSNDIASIEFFAVVYPNYYSRYTNKENNYSI